MLQAGIHQIQLYVSGTGIHQTQLHVTGTGIHQTQLYRRYTKHNCTEVSHQKETYFRGGCCSFQTREWLLKQAEVLLVKKAEDLFAPGLCV